MGSIQLQDIRNRNGDTIQAENRGAERALVQGVVLVAIAALAVIAIAPAQAAPGAWSESGSIEPGNFAYAEDPQVAVDGSGNAFAVWDRYDGATSNIWANRYSVGTGWMTAQLIEADAGVASKAQVAVDGSGNAVAVWQQHDGTRFNIWANRYVAGTGWGAAQLIETEDAGGAYGPQVAMDGSGNAFAVWYQSDGTWNNIWSNRYDAGAGWGTARLIETDNAGNAWLPQVAVDASGDAFAVWYQSDGTRNNIWSNRYPAGTRWGTAELIETSDVSNAWSPQVGVDASGNAVAVWYQFLGTPTEIASIYSNRYVAGRGWGTPELLETDDTADALLPQVAVDAIGNAIAVWYQYDGARYNILSNRYVVGRGWGTAQLIETDDAGNAAQPQVAVDANGNAVAVWTLANGTRDNVWANRYVAGTGWSAAQQIENSAGQALWPHVGVDGSGNAVTVWYQQAGVGPGIKASRLVEDYPPQLALSSPADGATTNASSAWISGTTEPGAVLSVNGFAVSPGPSGSFGVLVALTPGVNGVNVTAWDRAGNRATRLVSVTYNDPVPGLDQELAAAQAALASAQSELAQAESMVAQSQANVTAAESRVAALEANGSSTQAQLDAARADLTAAQATVVALQSAAANSTTALAAANARISALETNRTISQAPAAPADNTLAIVAMVIGVGGLAVGAAALMRSGRGPKAPQTAAPPADPPPKS
jgi:uncharacterized membrane-anchored protein